MCGKGQVIIYKTPIAVCSVHMINSCHIHLIFFLRATSWQNNYRLLYSNDRMSLAGKHAYYYASYYFLCCHLLPINIIICNRINNTWHT